MQSFKTTVTINVHRDEVYKALTTKEGLSGWWTEDCEISSAIGGTNTFRFGEMFVVMQIEKLVKDHIVVWRCVDQFFKFENVVRTNDWVGTILDFRLESNDDYSTTVQFIHEGLTSELASYDQSNMLWTYLITICLKGYLEKKKRFSQ